MSIGLIARCAVVILTACLLGDMATPLLPGAFRLDPSESVEVAAGRHVPLAGAVAPQQSPPARDTRRFADERSVALPVPGTYLRPPLRGTFGPRLARSAVHGTRQAPSKTTDASSVR